jgi:uncharacterized MnhB-related membrane protein
MATLFILIVFAYFVATSDASIAEKLVLAVLCAMTALLPIFVADAALPAAIAQGVLGVYVCLRMTYLRAKA